jgi:hypothetical protein
MKKIKIIILTFLLFNLIPQNVFSSTASNSTVHPVIFIHGFQPQGNTGDAFDKMIMSIFGQNTINQFHFEVVPVDFNIAFKEYLERSVCNGISSGNTIQVFPFNYNNNNNNKIYKNKLTCKITKDKTNTVTIKLDEKNKILTRKLTRSFPNKSLTPKIVEKNGVNFLPIKIKYNDTDTSLQENYIKDVLNLINSYVQKDNKKIGEIYIISHSMGGLGSWRFIHNQNTKNDIYKNKVTRFITLSSPFLGPKDGASFYSKMSTNIDRNDITIFSNDYISKFNSTDGKITLPNKFKYLSIYGNSDGFVSDKSAFALNEILKKNFNQKSYILNTDHTKIHQDSKTINLVKELILTSIP